MQYLIFRSLSKRVRKGKLNLTKKDHLPNCPRNNPQLLDRETVSIQEKPFEFIRSAKLDRVEQQESATKDSRQVIPIIFLGPRAGPRSRSAQGGSPSERTSARERERERLGPFRETRSFREVETCFQDSN